ncbi:MAG: c-type cytochrome domain-containing protein [Gallionella sp.]
MKIRVLLGAAVLAAFTLNARATEDQGAQYQVATKALGPSEVSFKQDVQPILYDYCVNCHSPGGKGYVKSGLDLTSYQGIMKGTRFGKVVIPGNSEVSTFTKLLTGTNKGLKMPMGLNSSGTLDRQFILVLRKWVNQGAKDN